MYDLSKKESLSESKASRRPTTFEGFFGESTLEAMRRTLGESGAKSVIFHSDLLPIFEDPKRLHIRFESMFGKSGAKRIEQVIISELYLRLKMDYKAEDPINDWNIFDFEKCTTYACRAFWERKPLEQLT